MIRHEKHLLHIIHARGVVPTNIQNVPSLSPSHPEFLFINAPSINKVRPTHLSTALLLARQLLETILV